MPLIECPSCGKPISDKAENCVHCGANLKKCDVCGTFFTGDGALCENCTKANDIPQPTDSTNSDDDKTHNSIDETDYMIVCVISFPYGVCRL